MKRKIFTIFFGLCLYFISMAQTWIPQSTGLTYTNMGIRNFSCVNDQVVWASITVSGGLTSDFTRTINGGTNWTSGTISNAGPLGITMIDAIDANHAWVTMNPVDYYFNYLPASVFATTDGGSTWTQQTTPQFGSHSSASVIHFWDINTGWCMGVAQNGTFEMFTTANGGMIWIPVPGALIPAQLTGEICLYSNMSVIGNHVWFGSSKGRVFSSNDQGHSWTVTAVPGFINICFPAFKDAQNGLAVCTTHLLDSSADGGATFIPLPFTGQVFTYELKFVPNTLNTFFTCNGFFPDNYTNQEGMAYTFDGGNTWNYETSFYGKNVTSTQWFNDSTGWIGTLSTDTTPSIYKFNGVLAPPVADFITANTNLLTGEQALFTNLSTKKPTSYSWTFEGGTPDTSTLQNPPPITYSLPGNYTVMLVVSSEFGSSTKVKTGYIQVGIRVGINEHSTSDVSIFPNPAKDQLHVNCNDKIRRISILDLNGKEVYYGMGPIVNIGQLNSGVYFVRILTDNGISNAKFIKE